MKKISNIYAFALALPLLAVSCQEKTAGPEAGETEYREIRITAGTPELKSLLDPSADQIYAYTFGGDMEPLGNFIPSGIEGGIYTYNIPIDADTVVFSNMMYTDSMLEVMLGSGDTLMVFKPLNSSYEDMAAGVADMASYPEDGSAMPVHLNRVTSKVSADLVIKSAAGDSLDVSQYISWAYITLSPQSSSYLVMTDGTMQNDIQGREFGMYGAEISESTKEYTICEDMSVPPTAAGTATSVLTLYLISHDGSSTSMSADLGYALERNKRYNLSISVLHSDTGFTFSIEDIITEDITVNLN